MSGEPGTWLPKQGEIVAVAQRYTQARCTELVEELRALRKEHVR